MILTLKQVYPNNILQHRILDISDGCYNIDNKEYDKVYFIDNKLVKHEMALVIFTFIYNENMCIYRKVIGSDEEPMLFMYNNRYSEQWLKHNELFNKEYKNVTSVLTCPKCKGSTILESDTGSINLCKCNN